MYYIINDILFHDRSFYGFSHPYTAKRLQAQLFQLLLFRLEGTQEKFEGTIRIGLRQNMQWRKGIAFKTSATVCVLVFLSPSTRTDNMINCHFYLKPSPLPFICK